MARVTFQSQHIRGSWKDFANWAATTYPEKAHGLLKIACFTIGTGLHSQMAKNTPVVTGYLRWTLSARRNKDKGYRPPPPRGKATPGKYVKNWPTADQATAEALALFGPGDILTIGYTAKYAPQIEDRYHMVKTAKAAFRAIAQRAMNAVRKAGG